MIGLSWVVLTLAGLSWSISCCELAYGSGICCVWTTWASLHLHLTFPSPQLPGQGLLVWGWSQGSRSSSRGACAAVLSLFLLLSHSLPPHWSKQVTWRRVWNREPGTDRRWQSDVSHKHRVCHSHYCCSLSGSLIAGGLEHIPSLFFPHL